MLEAINRVGGNGMKACLIAVVVATIATFGAPTMGIAASETDDALSDAPRVAALELSPRVHDDWALIKASTSVPLDLSPWSHDDWAVR